MPTKLPDLFAALAAPFESHEVKVRTQSGRNLHYITARTAMNRLDNVLGPENWWDEYTPHENSVLCRLTVRLPDGSTLTKADAGGYAGMADSGDDDKSGYSDAFKRACVKIGVGRYLYRDGVPFFVGETNVAGSLPEGSVHADSHRPADPARSAADHHNGHHNGAAANGHAAPNPHSGSVPRSGRGLFAWCKEQEQRHDVEIIKYLNGWAKLQDFPPKMVDWDAETVALAHKEAERKLAAGFGPGSSG